MSSDIPKSEFTHVDRTPNPHFFVQSLDRQNATVFNRLAKQKLVNLLDIQPGHYVLDVGCGVGQDASEMAKLVGDRGMVIGIDASQVMVSEARQRYENEPFPLNFQQQTEARERCTRLIYAVDAAEEHGTITASAAHQLRTYMEEAVADGRFFSAMTRFATIGTKPC